MPKFEYKNPKGAGRKRVRPDVETLTRLYFEEDKTASEVAKIYNVKPQTVYAWMNYYRKKAKSFE